ncbi:hypothetical protein WG66_012385 [Moniliophthora roreri]|nr:hypothetical protein WG66_012385 [Moniliophthora roreri]
MSDAATCTLNIPPLHNTMGALFIGVSLWGITSMQTYNYFLQYWRVDRPILNMTLMLSHLLYVYLVSNWGNPAILATLLCHSVLIDLFYGLTTTKAFIGFIVQLFLCYRVYVLSRNNYIVTGVVVLPVLALFTITMAYFGTAWSQHFTLFADLARIKGLSVTVNVLGAASDVVITSALSFYLWTSKSGIRKTDAIMNRLILFCVRSGLLTTVTAILSLITIQVYPDTFIYICFYSILARFYSFSLLATLNARSDLRSQTSNGANSFAASVSLEPNPGNAWSRRPQESSNGVRHIAIKQDVETMIDHGEYEMKPGQALP